MQSRLELPSARGDQTIGEVRFLLHGTSETEGRQIIQQGLSFIPGRPTASTSLLQAYGYATDPQKRGYSLSNIATTQDPGLIVAVAVPASVYVGYGVFTTAYIDRALKLVTGAPLRFAGARKQLAIYLDADTEAVRRRVEQEVKNGHALAGQPAYRIEPQFIVGSFAPTAGLNHILTDIEVSARAFEPLEYSRFEGALAELFTVREPAQAVLLPSMVHSLVIGTIEAVVMSRLRMMRWQGLALLGYRFHEGDEDVAVTRVKDIEEQKRRINELEQRLAAPNIFEGELAWLKGYAKQELNLMRVELEGEELESA